MKSKYALDFSEICMGDVALVGGKNASLGEMFRALKPKGVGVLDGFALTTVAYWRLLDEQGLRAKLEKIFATLDPARERHASGAKMAAKVQGRGFLTLPESASDCPLRLPKVFPLVSYGGMQIHVY